MKIYEIWEQVKNEPIEIRAMVLALLNPQLDFRFEQIVDEEIKKLGIVYGNECIANYLLLKLASDKSLYEFGLIDHYELMLYRELLSVVNTITVNTEDDYGYPADDIDIQIGFKNSTPSKELLELLLNILHKVYESEYIDITDSTLSNLKTTRQHD